MTSFHYYGENKKPQKLKARQPRGFVDRGASDIRAMTEMMDKIKSVYERYGFDPVETPMFEYTDCLGKFLPDTDRPNAGVFSVLDDDEQWMSLRYDLTAPLRAMWRKITSKWRCLSGLIALAMSSATKSRGQGALGNFYAI